MGHRCGSDVVLLWLWHRPAAVGLIRPLAWEPPYAAGAALKKKTKKKKCLHNWSSPRSSAVTNLISVHEDAGSIPGITPWVKDPVLPRAVVLASSFSSDLTPSLGTFICCRFSPKKKKKSP